MALGKRKGPGDKVARLEKKGEKFVSKLEKAKAAGPKEGPNKKVMKLASKAGKAFGKAARAKGNVVTESAKELLARAALYSHTSFKVAIHSFAAFPRACKIECLVSGFCSSSFPLLLNQLAYIA